MHITKKEDGASLVHCDIDDYIKIVKDLMSIAPPGSFKDVEVVDFLNEKCFNINVKNDSRLSEIMMKYDVSDADTGPITVVLSTPSEMLSHVGEDNAEVLFWRKELDIVEKRVILDLEENAC